MNVSTLLVAYKQIFPFLRNTHGSIRGGGMMYTAYFQIVQKYVNIHI